MADADEQREVRWVLVFSDDGTLKQMLDVNDSCTSLRGGCQCGLIQAQNAGYRIVDVRPRTHESVGDAVGRLLKEGCEKSDG